MKLGVNIDHVATLREQRKEGEPDLVAAAKTVLKAGADGITIHLREDRRHIQDQDVLDIKKLTPRLNLECSTDPKIIDLACQVKPLFCCLVPEKREELTTEGGLNVIQFSEKLKQVIKQLTNAGIFVSLFIEPDFKQIDAAKQVGAHYIEIHTGHYANADEATVQNELEKIKKATKHALSIGLRVNAGHGLKYHNVKPIAAIQGIEELNIGHSIISRSLFTGLEQAVLDMKLLVSSPHSYIHDIKR